MNDMGHSHVVCDNDQHKDIQFEMSFSASGDLLKFNNRNSRKKLYNMFKVNDKDTRAMSMNIFHTFFLVPTVDFEQLFPGRN